MGRNSPKATRALRRESPCTGKIFFPPTCPSLKSVVLTYMAAMTRLGHALMSAISMSLGLDETYFHEHYTKDPLVLFRIFHYPAPEQEAAKSWGRRRAHRLRRADDFETRHSRRTRSEIAKGMDPRDSDSAELSCATSAICSTG